MVHTILIPREAVSKFLSLKLHVKSDWNKKFRLVGILMNCCRIKVIITRIHSDTKLKPKALEHSPISKITTNTIQKGQHHGNKCQSIGTLLEHSKDTADSFMQNINTHTTHNRFTAGLEYVRVHPGQQVPER